MIDRRQLCDDLTDLMIRLLHIQQHGEPHYEIVAEWNAMPQALVRRYQTEPMFHAQVQRAVASILDLVHKAERTARQENLDHG